MIIQPIELVEVVGWQHLIEVLQQLEEHNRHLIELNEVVITAFFWIVATMGILVGLLIMTLFAIAWRKA